MPSPRRETPCQNKAYDPDGPIENLPPEPVADDFFIDPPSAGTGTGKGTVEYRRRRRALEACWNDCPVRARLACLDMGLEPENLQWGIWGGYTEEQRKIIHDERKKRR